MDLQKQQWKYHILIITTIIVMNFFGDYVFNGTEGFLKNFNYPSVLNNIAYHSAFFVIYFLNFNVVAPKTLSQKNIAFYILGVFVLIFVFAGLRYFLEEIILFNITGRHNYYDATRRPLYYVFDNSYYAIKAVLFSLSLYLFFQFIKNKERVLQLEVNHKKAELSLLKTQLEPHFLFNTLNSFYTELVDTQPETAKDIFKLSQLLRYVTYEAQQDFMPLNKELEFINDYIHLQRKRFEDSLFLEYNIEGVVGNQQIPSLVLIHFVENIFKHAILNNANHPAQLNIRITSKTLELTTENKILTSKKYTEQGIGEANLRRRLTAIYNTDYTLNFEQNGLTFKSYLKLPFKNETE
jgi:hypothetical protein